VSTFLYKVIVL